MKFLDPIRSRELADHPALLRTAMAATLLLPLALLYTRAIGDVLLSLVGVLFLVRVALRGDATWLRATHTRLALAFWLWMVICTLAGGNGQAIGQALASIRLFLFAIALEHWVLESQPHRRALELVILAAATWVVVETWQQYVFGTNMFGWPRWGSGVLTGPFGGPRAGQTLQALYFPAFLPPAIGLMLAPRLLARAGGAAILIVTMLTMVIIGQRMPMLLLVLGLCLTGLVVRRFRLAMLIALAVLVLCLAATPILSPVTYETLIVTFVTRMQHFWDTQYAMLYERAIVMVQAHPWLGLGYDGFRNHCDEPEYLRALSWLPVTDFANPLGCTIHPHNYWLQVATSTGVTGLLLFAALCTAWLMRIGHDAFSGARPKLLALFVTVCIALWPIASTTSLFTVPNAGWFFLMVGWGLAEQRSEGSA